MSVCSPYLVALIFWCSKEYLFDHNILLFRKGLFPLQSYATRINTINYHHSPTNLYFLLIKHKALRRKQIFPVVLDMASSNLWQFLSHMKKQSFSQLLNRKVCRGDKINHGRL